MKKIKSILLITLVAINISSCQNNTNNKLMNLFKSNKKYDFTTTACMPTFYIAEVIDGTFYLADGTARYIPAGGIIKTGWGGNGATHIGGPDLKALPVGFSITWVSYLERKFYKGRFELDKDLVATYFKEGYIDYRKKQETFNTINAGVAPGGVVVVWLRGSGLQVEIGRFKAKEIEMTMSQFRPHAVLSLEKYINNRIERIPKELQNSEFLDNIPFGLWDSYRKKYTWKPKVLFDNGGKLTAINIHYYNGERILTHGENPELIDYRERAVPKYINLNWEDKNQNPFGADIYFGSLYEEDTAVEYQKMEEEIFNAFKKINKTPNTKTELVFRIDNYNSHVTLFLQSKTDTLKISKAEIKTYMKTKR